MADARDLQKSVGNGDGAWFATQDGDGRGRARDDDGQVVAVGAAEPTDGVMVETAQFVPTVYLYDNFPGGVGLRSEEHTSALQSLMRISYAVFVWKNKIAEEHHSCNK